MTRIIRSKNDPVRVAIVDDTGLIYSDDYRLGWVKGFQAIGCDVRVHDISQVRRAGVVRSPYSTGGGMRGFPKMIAQQIAKESPDLMFAHHGRAASHEAFMQVFKARRIRTAVYLCDEPYEVGETARYSHRFDYIFSMDPCTLETHRKASRKSKVFYLPPGVDTDHFICVPYKNRKVPIRFLGNASLAPRPKYLKPIERLFGDDADIRFWPKKSKGRRRAVMKGDEEWVPIQKHPEHYSGCLIGLNIYRDPAITTECFKRRCVGRPRSMPVPAGMKLCEQMPDQDGTGFWNDPNLPAAHINPRFLEMAACGTLVISDDSRAEHQHLFPMSPLAEDPGHMVELIHYYLGHPSEAEEIGRACSYLISKRHSYAHRAGEVLIRAGLKASDDEDLRSYLGEPEDWLSHQDFQPHGARSHSVPTGRSGRWSPAFGLSSIRTSGNPSVATSLDVQNPWLS